MYVNQCLRVSDRGYSMDKRIKSMIDYGFEVESVLVKLSEVELEKKYKCYMSKICNDEKYSRIKKMFDYVKNDEKFVKYMGVDYDKLKESFINESRGEGVKKVDYNNMGIMEVFNLYKLGVKEVCKKGYKVENDVYIKI